ncbi:MAG: CoA transferase [Spirochaetota bacterium]|nr:CoA transferase [Spirochaetota bacterium]
MTRPLDGIRILDWTIFQQGPVATMMLAELGADVIKIEHRVEGDPARGLMKMIGAMIGGDSGRNPYYENNNRGKRCITIDVTKPEGKELIYKLVEKSDVFVHNFRMGVDKRLGLDYETLKKHNEKLIYAHASGWGPKGPDANDPSADYTGVARSGLMSVAGEPHMDPQMVQAGVGDQMGATMTAYGVLAALLARERHGIGQKVEVGLFGSLMHLLGLAVTMRCISKLPTMRLARTQAGNPLWNHYKCKDDKWVALAHLQPDKFWSGFCKSMGLEHLENDPKFKDMNTRGANAQELIQILDKTFATQDRDHWMDIFKNNNVIYSRLNTIADLEDDPQAIENEYITEFDHPTWGKIREMGFPVVFSETPNKITRAAPEFGEHTEEILQEILGTSWEDIAKLKDTEVI